MLVLLSLSCSENKQTPSIEQFKKDMVFNGINNYTHGIANIQADNIKLLTITDRRTDTKSGTDEVDAMATIANGEVITEGMLRFNYKLYDQGWKFQKLVYGNFKVIDHLPNIDEPKNNNKIVKYSAKNNKVHVSTNLLKLKIGDSFVLKGEMFGDEVSIMDNYMPKVIKQDKSTYSAVGKGQSFITIMIAPKEWDTAEKVIIDVEQAH